MRRRRVLLLAVIALPAMALGVGLAVAGSDAVHVCVRDASGTLRLVGSQDDCRPQESAIALASHEAVEALRSALDDLSSQVADLEERVARLEGEVPSDAVAY